MRIEQTRKLFALGDLPEPPPSEEIGRLALPLEALRLTFG